MPNTDRPKRKILVVEDDEAFRNGLKYLLKKTGYDPVLTMNAKTAMQLLAKGGIDIVLSDIDIPGGNGFEILKYAQKNHQIPVILMTGLKSLIDIRSSLKDRQIKLLAKPFGQEEIAEALESYFPSPAEPAPAPPPPTPLAATFCSIPIDDFVAGREMQYDLYIQLSPDNYVKIAHAGSPMEMERIVAFKEKGIQSLYLKKENFRDYVRFSMKITQSLQKASAIDLERKLQFLQKTSKLLLQSAFVSGVNSETLSQGTEVVESAVSILAENDAFFGLMDLMSSARDERLYSHSLAVSLYSTMIATKLGWTSPKTIFYIAAGALFHDIGKRELPEDILCKPRTRQTREERKVYENHSLKGAAMLRSIPNAPIEIIRIVQQHHENEAGSGYPFHLRRGKVFPLAKLVSVADEFCDAIQREETLSRDIVMKVFDQMRIFGKDTLDPSMIAALMSVFQLEIPDDLKNSISVSTQRKIA